MNKHGPPPPGFMPPPPYSNEAPPPSGAPSVVIMHSIQLGPEPTTMVCPYCAANIKTLVETTPSTKTHIMALLLCLFGCWPCAPCVYCADSCLLKQHHCPNCQKFLGAYDN